MNGGRLGLLCALALVASSPMALAQDSAVSPPPRAVPKPPKAQPPPAVITPKAESKDPQVKTAHQMASIATREATCLREAAQQVALAAERVTKASPDTLAKRREELTFQLGVMDECRNIARQRETESSRFAEPPPRSPATAEPVPERRGHFRFGEITIDSGAADVRVMVSPLRRNADRFTRCYQRAGKAAPKNKLRLHMRMVPSESGARPATVAIPGAPQQDGGLHRCLVDALVDTPFPRSLAGSDVSFMMGFSTH